jgi:hypothetical protein
MLPGAQFEVPELRHAGIGSRFTRRFACLAVPDGWREAVTLAARLQLAEQIGGDPQEFGVHVGEHAVEIEPDAQRHG